MLLKLVTSYLCMSYVIQTYSGSFIKDTKHEILNSRGFVSVVYYQLSSGLQLSEVSPHS